MSNQELRSSDFYRSTPAAQALARESRKKRVMSIVADSLPTPQGRIFELVRLLAEPVLNLTGVTEIVRAEPLLNTHIWGLLGSSSPEEPCPAAEFSQAVVLLGAERLRILASGCALAEFAGRRLPVETMRAFWHHSLLTALLSKKIARDSQPEAIEKAYLGGLLHDIGRLPFLIDEHEQEAAAGKASTHANGQPACERPYFGLDHCEVGRWIALSGNFSPWMVDVIEHHHDPSQSVEDPHLVAIIAAADGCNELCSQFPMGVPAEWPGENSVAEDVLRHARPRGLLEDNQALRSEFLETTPSDSVFPTFGSS